MSIPIPSGMTRGRVSWRIGHDRAGSTLPGASGTVRFEPTAVAVAYSTVTVLPEPVETPVIGGVMTPVDLQVNDPEVWNWKVQPRVGVTWEPFHVDVPGPVDLATAVVVPGVGPVRAVKGAKGDTPTWGDLPGKPTTFPPAAHQHAVADVDGLAARLAALEYRSGVRNISSLLTNVSLGPGTSGAWVERAGSMVTFSLESITPTAGLASGGSFITLPVGFRPTKRYDLHLISTTSSPNRSAYIFPTGTLGVWTPSTSDRYRFMMTFPTNDPIPATPPGVPG